MVTSVVTILFGIAPAVSWLQARERAAYVAEAWAHFRKLCSEKAGEKIYKTYSGVKSVLVVKALPPATEKDLYDQFWMGDPYSNATPWAERGMTAALRLVGLVKNLEPPRDSERGFDFVELSRAIGAAGEFERIDSSDSQPFSIRTTIQEASSRFGIAWEDISTESDRKYWIAGSRLRVFDRSNDSVVAERIGYVIESGFGSRAGNRMPWLASRGPESTCPALRNGDYEDRWFVLGVLRPGTGG